MFMGLVATLRSLSDVDLKRLLERPDLVPKYLFAGAREGFGACEDLDLDKSAQGITYLLSGAAAAVEGVAAFLVDGGVPLGDEDVPAHGFDSAQVRRIADLLVSIGYDTLTSRIDTKSMADNRVS